MILGHGVGPPHAKILIVGEAWGATEEWKREPFVGASGDLLNDLLKSAGLMRSECFVTNLVNARPPNNDLTNWIPDTKKKAQPGFVLLREKLVAPVVVEGFQSLLREISLVKPNIILALGGSALWALTGLSGITKWRGSQLWFQPPGGFRTTSASAIHHDRVSQQSADGAGETSRDDAPRIKLIPSIHPAAVLRDMSLKPIVKRDLQRVAAEKLTKDYSNVPTWQFTTRPTFDQAIDVLESLFTRLESGEQLWIDFDLETRLGHISCAGISWSGTEAICIPFMSSEKRDGYWSAEEEAALVYDLYRILTHPTGKVRGQNLLYDSQYTWRWWHFIPRVAQDTMIEAHALFAGMPKSLDFLASLYCDHYTQWKPDKVVWKEGG